MAFRACTDAAGALMELVAVAEGRLAAKAAAPGRLLLRRCFEAGRS